MNNETSTLFAARPHSPAAHPSAVRPPTAIPPPARSPVELRFRTRDDWYAGLKRYLLPLDCSVFDPRAFRCEAVIAQLCGATIAELRVDASRLVRRPMHISAAEHECVKVFWQLSGRSRFQQGPNTAVLETGHWTICDSGREYTIELERNTRCLLLLVPRRHCAQWLPALSVLSARTLPAGGTAHIAMAALTAMLRNAAPLDADSEIALRDSVVALIECALANELASRGLQAQAERSLHLPQVQAYVLAHLADPALNVGKLARVFGVSRRSLYNLFAASGVTPHTFISDAKLNRACALLRLSSSQVSVAGVARQCGFADPAHFSRAFHARHGVAPTTWREQAA
jgi:AraC family transcriptional regulator, positive regulator of tynA and feaB